jgi:hypothetical protein
MLKRRAIPEGYFATGDIGPFLSVTGDRNTIVTGDMDLSQNRQATCSLRFLKVDKRHQGSPQYVLTCQGT